MAYILFRYLHFIAIACFAGSLLIENSAISRTITSEDSRNLAKVDAVYGISALLVFLFGLALWLWVGKPSEFYNQNSLFQIKVGLFIVVALMAAFPSVFLFKHRKSEADSITVPRLVIWLMRAELVVLVFIPILAVLMARGIGLND